MKSPTDPRHLKRVLVFKSLFAGSFTDQEERPSRVDKIYSHLEEIDAVVQKCAPEWPVPQINKVDLAVLRQAIYELLYKTQTPVKVIIDEAVEIAKRYGGKTSSSFVNGALATAIAICERTVPTKEEEEAEKAKRVEETELRQDSQNSELKDDTEDDEDNTNDDSGDDDSSND